MEQQRGTSCSLSASLYSRLTLRNAQLDIVNELFLLTAKPVTYLVNLSEKDYIRKKNKWCAHRSSALCARARH